MAKILIVQGSLRKDGFNSQLQKIIEKKLEVCPEVDEIEVLDYEGLPYMNQDLENPELELIARLRESFKSADGIWIVSPQYNGSYPGHIKTLVDWMSRPVPGKGRDSVAIAGAKMTISGAGGRTATALMREKLNDLLQFVGAKVLTDPQLGVALPPESWKTGKLILNENDYSWLEEQRNAFISFITGQYSSLNLMK